jgi:hypothetical protein
MGIWDSRNNTRLLAQIVRGLVVVVLGACRGGTLLAHALVYIGGGTCSRECRIPQLGTARFPKLVTTLMGLSAEPIGDDLRPVAPKV